MGSLIFPWTCGGGIATVPCLGLSLLLFPFPGRSQRARRRRRGGRLRRGTFLSVGGFLIAGQGSGGTLLGSALLLWTLGPPGSASDIPSLMERSFATERGMMSSLAAWLMRLSDGVVPSFDDSSNWCVWRAQQDKPGIESESIQLS